jgi:primosomal protein N' (replication factor Y)
MRLVVVIDADTQLVNPDFRAPERLFATLMQVAGRAGRHAHHGHDAANAADIATATPLGHGQASIAAQVLIQTRYPQHRLYRYLMGQDVEGFAKAEMEDRKVAGLPPFAHMAAVRASHADPRKVQSALRGLRDELQEVAKTQGWPATVYGPVARYPEIQAGRWRGQIMIESALRPPLHQLLAYAEDWMQAHRSFDPHLDVDPVEV